MNPVPRIEKNGSSTRPAWLKSCFSVLLVLMLSGSPLAGCSDDKDEGSQDVTTDQTVDVPNDGEMDLPGDVEQDQDGSDVSDDMEDMTGDMHEDVTGDTNADMAPPVEMDSYLYVAETDGDITVYAINDETGALTEEGVLEQGGNMQFLAFGPNNDRLYAANGSSVQAFDISGGIVPTFLSQADAGIGGTHLDIAKTRQHAFTASYGGDAVAMVALDENGEPGAVEETLGGGAMPEFCENAHQVRVHPSNSFVYVPCLGSDHVAILTYDPGTPALTSSAVGNTAAGAGPRHLDFHPTLDVAYVINELNSTIDVFTIDTETGGLNPLQTISTVPGGTDPSRSSDIHVSPDGNFVYGMNREPENSIARYAVQPNGTLVWLGTTPTGGDHARTFAIHPNGQWLFTGNSNSQDITTFSRNLQTGDLTQVGEPLGGFSDRVFYVGIRQVPNN